MNKAYKSATQRQQNTYPAAGFNINALLETGL